MKIVRKNNSDPDFLGLCSQLDNELNKRYGKSQAIYNKHNVIEGNQTVIVGYVNDIPVASGCFKVIKNDTIEIKRMYVKLKYRRRSFLTA